MNRYDRLIIDGYNLLHKWEPGENGAFAGGLAAARHRLVRFIEHTARTLADRTVIVFDGRAEGTDEALSAPDLEILFSGDGCSADALIERLVARVAGEARTLVVTSDRAERRIVLGAGAQAMSAAEFLDRCRTAARRTPPPAPPRRLGDLFPTPPDPSRRNH